MSTNGSGTTNVTPSSGSRWLELVLQRQAIGANRKIIGKPVSRGIGSFTLHEIRARHVQHTGVLAFRAGTPVLKRRDRTHALGNALRVKLHLRLLIDEYVAPANLRLQRLDFLAELAIRVEEVAANGTIRTRAVAAVTRTSRASAIPRRATCST